MKAVQLGCRLPDLLPQVCGCHLLKLAELRRHLQTMSMWGARPAAKGSEATWAEAAICSRSSAWLFINSCCSACQVCWDHAPLILERNRNPHSALSLFDLFRHRICA